MIERSSEIAPFLTADWRHLLLLNFEIEPSALRQRVPEGTELDLWNGRALVSLVGFQFLRTRLHGIPIPFHVNFDEVNLRFYVRRRVGSEVRRGVVFIREIVPRRAIAWVANRRYNEHYVMMPMRSSIRLPNGEGTNGAVEYGWKFRGRWNRMAAEIAGLPKIPAADSEEAFITEHYWGYVRNPDDATTEYQVAHRQWRLYDVSDAELDCDAGRLYGDEFAASLSGRPVSAFVAEGSAVHVGKGRRL